MVIHFYDLNSVPCKVCFTDCSDFLDYVQDSEEDSCLHLDQSTPVTKYCRFQFPVTSIKD